jgi:LCP family protein required for cell wall assembly
MRTTLKRGAHWAAEKETAGNGTPTNGSGNGAPPVLPPLTAMSRYGRPYRRRPLVTVAKVFGWIVVVVLMLAVGVAGGAALWGEDLRQATAPKTKAEKEAQEILDKAPDAPDAPVNAIVIGYDKRPGETAHDSRSDTIMLVRLDPRGNAISMLSFPRDLRAELAGCKRAAPTVAKINEAFTNCGPKGTIETVKKLTGIPINYYVLVNFAGFIKVVDRMGGVYMDVDHRYFNDSSGYGGYSAIDLQPGYQRLSGADALAYVRFRHTDNDLYRNARQQAFVKAVKQQLGLRKVPGVLDAATENVTIAASGKGALPTDKILSFAKLAYGLPSGNFFQPRLENLGQNNLTFELLADQAEIDRVVHDFMNPDTDSAAKATDVATGNKSRKPKPTGPPAREVSIEVMNGNGVAGDADRAATLLGHQGYPAGNGGNALKTTFKTQILYDPAAKGGALAANRVAVLFGDADVGAAAPDDQLSTMLRVTVGTTFKGTLAPLPADTTPQHSAPHVTTDAIAETADARQAQQKVGFPVLVPTVHESSSRLSSLSPYRAYRLNGKGAVRFVYNGPYGTDYWGIQETAWENPPVLSGPTLTRTIAGRDYKLYYNGAKLHMVAFTEGGASYWVTNTLLDAMSNETMLAIAKGLKPLGTP